MRNFFFVFALILPSSAWADFGAVCSQQKQERSIKAKPGPITYRVATAAIAAFEFDFDEYRVQVAANQQIEVSFQVASKSSGHVWNSNERGHASAEGQFFSCSIFDFSKFVEALIGKNSAAEYWFRIKLYDDQRVAQIRDDLVKEGYIRKRPLRPKLVISGDRFEIDEVYFDNGWTVKISVSGRITHDSNSVKLDVEHVRRGPRNLDEDSIGGGANTSGGRIIPQ